MSFKTRVETIAQSVFNQQHSKQQPLVEKSVANTKPTGEAEISKINTDGTVNVKINDRIIENVSTSKAPKVGSKQMLVNGKRLI